MTRFSFRATPGAPVLPGVRPLAATWGGLLAVLLGLLGAGPAQGQLSGVYEIGGPVPDYPTIGAAVADLEAQGVSGATTFWLYGGTYDEQVTIPAITGASATNVITFKKKPGIASAPVWQATAASPTANWVLKLDGTAHVTVSDITFRAQAGSPPGRLVWVANSTNAATFTGCTFEGLVTSNPEGVLVQVENGSSHTFLNNTFLDGYRGVEMLAIVSIYTFTSGLMVAGNTFTNQYNSAVWFTRSSATITENTISSIWPTGYDGIEMALDPGPGGYQVEITRNTLYLPNGGTGLTLYGPCYGLVANNMIALRGAGGQHGIYVGGEVYGLDVVHNTVHVGDAGVAVTLSEDTERITLRNNLLLNEGGGLVLVYEAGSPSLDEIDVDDNNLYTTGPTLAEHDGIAYADQEALRLAFDWCYYGVSVPVTFAGPSNLHLAAPSDADINLLAPHLKGNEELEAALLGDLDGDARNAYSTFKGADEGATFLPLDNADTAAGYYTVGPQGYPGHGGFAGLHMAFRRLHQRGIKGPVTFRIQAYTYETKLLLSFARHAPAGGIGPTPDPVVLRPVNFSAPPTIQYDTSAEWKSAVVQLYGVYNVVFQSLNFATVGAGNGGRVVAFDLDEVHGITFEDCTFSDLTTSGDAVLIEGEWLLPAFDYPSPDLGLARNPLVIRDSRFVGGETGLSFPSNSIDYPLTVSGNSFEGQSQEGLYTEEEFSETEISANTFSSTAAGYRGIWLDYYFFVFTPPLGSTPTISTVVPHLLVVGNQVAAQGDGSVAAEFKAVTTREGGEVLIANNFFSGRSAGFKSTYASSTFNEGGWRVVHNTVRGQDQGFYAQYKLEGVTFLNNLFEGGTDAPAFFIGEPLGVASDYNNFYRPGSGTLVHWDGTDYATLAAYQAATGHDAHAASVPVTYVDFANGDLHLAGASVGDLSLSGTPAPDVTVDLDGEARSATVPYMGADEAALALTPPLALTLTAFLQGPYDAGTGLMTTALLGGGYLPATQPFSDAAYDGTPLDYDGSESVGSFPAGTVDWVLVELRSSTDAASLVAQQAALLLSDGSLAMTDGSSPLSFAGVADGSYYVVLRHRNHLAVMSSNPVDCSSGACSYDFTSTLAQAYTTGADAMAALGASGSAPFGLFSGDGNATGDVTSTDRNGVWQPQSGSAGYLGGDFNLSADVTSTDRNVYWKPNNGKGSQVPGS